MILVFGGAYQGKLDFAKDKFNLSDDQVFYCENSLNIDLSKKIIYNFQSFVHACVVEGIEAKDYIANRRLEFEDKIIIITDISQGIVPMDPKDRALREMVGRAMLYLAKESHEVYRIFCGLSQKLK